MTEPMIIALISAFGAIGTGSGIWSLINRRAQNTSAFNRLVMGLAYDKIVTIGTAYIQRGYVSADEYEAYLKLLVEPYKEMGGNGVAERVAGEVATLKFRTVAFLEVVNKEGNNNASTE